MLFASARATDPGGLYTSIDSLVMALLAPLYPLLFKVLIDAAVDHETTTTITVAAAAIAITSAVSAVAGSYSAMFGWNLWERMTFTLDERLVSATARIGLVDRVERPNYMEHLTLVRTGREHFQESMMSLNFAGILAIQVLVTVIILASVAPVLLLLPVFSIAPIWASRWAEARTQRALEDSAEDTRAADGFALLSVEIGPSAGELRVLRLRDMVIGRHQAAWGRAMGRQWKAETQGAVVSTLALIFFTLGFGGALLLVTVQALHGDTSIGSVILVLTAGQQLHNQIGGVLASWGNTSGSSRPCATTRGSCGTPTSRGSAGHRTGR